MNGLRALDSATPTERMCVPHGIGERNDLTSSTGARGVGAPMSCVMLCDDAARHDVDLVERRGLGEQIFPLDHELVLPRATT